jgi:spore coat polysaccharide biosynthesis protein SpsF
MNTIIIQARMTSTRLPGKVLKEVLGKALLHYQIERLRSIPNAQIVIATTVNATDDPVVALALRLDLRFYRGSEDDVLSRYYGAAKEAGAENVVRMTADCPLIDPGVSAAVIALRGESGCDYASNILKRSFPRGLDTEAMTFTALEKAHHEATSAWDREHVTPYIYNNGNKFSILHHVNPTDESHHRWTVDTPEDFELVERIISALYPEKPDFTWLDVLELLKMHPDWVHINAHVEQKKANS